MVNLRRAAKRMERRMRKAQPVRQQRQRVGRDRPAPDPFDEGGQLLAGRSGEIAYRSRCIEPPGKPAAARTSHRSRNHGLSGEASLLPSLMTVSRP